MFIMINTKVSKMYKISEGKSKRNLKFKIASR